MMTKRDEVYEMLVSQTEAAIAQRIATMDPGVDMDAIRRHRASIASAVAYQITEPYRFLQLADIMGWKRTTSKR